MTDAETTAAGPARQPRRRPGGRSARVRSAVLDATLALLAERGFDELEIPEVARRSDVHSATIYRRWGSKARLVGEALLERGRPLSSTPDTGNVAGDLEHLLVDGTRLLRTPAVRALFAVLLSGPEARGELAEARERFWIGHLADVATIVERAINRSELPAGTDPRVVVGLVIGPPLVRTILEGAELSREEIPAIVDRALEALRRP